MLYALHFLKPGGRLVAITSAMAGVGNTRARQYFRATMQALGADRSQLPEDAFAASGTRVHTALWLLTMPASVELPPEAPPEETPAPPHTNPVDALDALQHAAYQCVEGSLGRADAPEDLARVSQAGGRCRRTQAAPDGAARLLRHPLAQGPALHARGERRTMHLPGALSGARQLVHQNLASGPGQGATTLLPPACRRAGQELYQHRRQHAALKGACHAHH